LAPIALVGALLGTSAVFRTASIASTQVMRAVPKCRPADVSVGFGQSDWERGTKIDIESNGARLPAPQLAASQRFAG
jgi:hypothetical protein